MKIREVIAPLYHGTLKRNIPQIRSRGLLPQRGTRISAEWGKTVPELAYASTPGHRKAILDSIHHYVAEFLGKGLREVTAADIIENGAVAVVDAEAWKFQHALGAGRPHASLGAGDFYSEFPVRVDEFLVDDDLKKFFRYWLGPARSASGEGFAEPEIEESIASPYNRVMEDIALFEMANLGPEQTGIPGTIYISTRQGAHAPRVKYFSGRPGNDKASMSVVISRKAQIVENSLPEQVVTQMGPVVQQWVRQNAEGLRNFWFNGNTWMKAEVDAFIDNLVRHT